MCYADIRLFSAVTPVIFGYSDQFKGDKWPYEYDNANIEKVKELLTEAGYLNGLDVEFVIDDSSDRIAVAEVIKNQLEAAGIRTNLSGLREQKI
ncbi:MAG: ABC transporter substrate-binding protein [Christensenellales bacterium]